jgi:hypothetical protein
MKLSHERLLEVVASLDTDLAATTEQRIDPRLVLHATVFIAPCVGGRLVNGRCVDAAGADLQPGPAFAVRVQDISSGGAAFQHFDPLPKNSLFVLELPTGNHDAAPGTLRLLCRVLHSRVTAEHRFVIGSQFIRIWTAPVATLEAMRLSITP